MKVPRSVAAAVPVALSVAGSDSGGGAGIQADLKTFHRFGVYGASAVTLVTAQNTSELRRVEPLSPELVAAQIEAVAEDFPVHATKTGALGSASIVEAVTGALERHDLRPLVVDPILVSKQGNRLLDADGLDALRRRLLPRATLLVPNLDEAQALLGGAVRGVKEMREAARALQALGPEAVLVTGGHAPGDDVVDVLFDQHGFAELRAVRVAGRNDHGTGCTLSAAITAGLARGQALAPAVAAAKRFVTRALETAPGLGHGRGPLNHWA